MLLHSNVAVVAATISLGLLSQAIADDGEWRAELKLPPIASTDDDEWNDITVVAIAPDGTWGVATEPNLHRAINDAIGDCKRKYERKIGCGSQITSVVSGWSLGKRCGNYVIFVAEKSLAHAEQAATNREAELRQLYAPNMPPCVRVMSVDPHGNVVAPDVAELLRILVDRPRTP
jgi:hypothetical protein